MHASDLLVPLRPNSLWWPRLVVALALLVSVWLGVRLLWLLLSGPVLDLDSASPGLPPLPATRSDTPAVALSQWHLFGDGGSTPDLAQRTQQAPETPLQLVLRGTLNLDNSDGGVAIVSDASGQDAGYKVGDVLPGDATLVAIYAGRVLLRRNGVDEGLSLQPGMAPTTARVGRSATPPSTSRMPAGLVAPGSKPALPGSPGTPFVNPQINVGAPSLESLRAATGTDIAELAKQVNVQPVMENGRFAGVRLTVGRDSDLLARSGLRATDLITEVNGIPLDGPQRQGELLNMLRNARQLNLTIRRDGATQTLTVGL